MKFNIKISEFTQTPISVYLIIYAHIYVCMHIYIHMCIYICILYLGTMVTPEIDWREKTDLITLDDL